MARQIYFHGWTILVLTLYGPIVHAQQTGPGKNDPREQFVTPYPSFLSSGGAGDSVLDLPQAPSAEVQVAGDDRPLSGVQGLTLGSHVGVRNYLVPSINVASQVATNFSSSGSEQPTQFTYLLGTLDLNHTSDRSELNLQYAGGGMLSSYVNSAIQDLEFTYNIDWRRWSFLVGDQFSYLSESPFGFGGVGGIAFLIGNPLPGSGGVSGPILNPSVIPNQTIPTVIVPRLSNTLVSQIEYKLSPRSTWTASGSFGTLNFLGAGYIDSIEGQFQTGYNYSLNLQSSMAVIYRFDAFRYRYFPQGVEDHILAIGYGRSVTGRLRFQIAAGPSVAMLRGIVTGYSNELSWALDTSLNYQLDRTALLISYNHLVTGGSGVLFGAQTSQFEAIVKRNLTSRWQGSASIGYAHNQSLVPATVVLGEGPLNSWYTAFQFNHDLRPGTAIFFSYGARLQATTYSACATANCRNSFISQQVSAGFNFGLRPILFK